MFFWQRSCKLCMVAYLRRAPGSHTHVLHIVSACSREVQDRTSSVIPIAHVSGLMAPNDKVSRLDLHLKRRRNSEGISGRPAPTHSSALDLSLFTVHMQREGHNLRCFLCTLRTIPHTGSFASFSRDSMQIVVLDGDISASRTVWRPKSPRRRFGLQPSLHRKVTHNWSTSCKFWMTPGTGERRRGRRVR